MADFWHTANCAFTDTERVEFNQWKLKMYLASDETVTAANGLPDENSYGRVAARARALHSMICEIPSLEK